MEKTPTHLSSRTAAVLMAAAAIMPLASHVAQAHGDSLIQAEIARRADNVKKADAALLEGRQLYAEEKYEEAVAKYSEALGLLPSGPAVADRRHAFTGHLVDGSIALSTKFRRVGKYNEARQLLNSVLAKDPNNQAAQQELEYLDDPIRTNPALTYEHTKDVDKVRKHLYLAEGYFNLGKFDEAEAEYKETLRVDKYNKAARRGMERVNNAKADYYRAAYDHTRSELLRQVDQAWEIAVPPRVTEGPDTTVAAPQTGGADLIRQKLRSINLPLVDFQDITVDQVIEVLRQRAFELDTTALDPATRGVNFVLRLPNTAAAEGGEEGEFGTTEAPGSKRISSLQLRNVPLEVAIQQVCESTGLRYRVEDFAVVLLSNTDVEDTEFYTRQFSVPPGFLDLIAGDGAGGGGGSDDPFADDEGDTGFAPRPPVKDLLEASGVVFPEGATANYSSARAVLTVRNTTSNLDIIEELVQNVNNTKPKQIRMETKFVEVSQENSDELGFDWILSPLPLAGSNNAFLGGGSIGNGAARTGSNFNSPVDGFTIPGVGGANESVSNIVTGGNRSGGFAINRNSIDSFLNNTNRSTQGTSVAPGILSMTGLFSDGQVQVIMRGLAQKKGADIMTAPSIVASPGKKATIEIVREFIYPTEYEPPEIPNSTGNTVTNSDNGNNNAVASSVFPVTPATPTAFETRNTGVTLEVEPSIGEDGYTISFELVSSIVDFEGFINYGSPIQTSASDRSGNPVTVTITENRIEMPVFSTRRVNTSLTIYDGHTVAIGGLMREDVQNVEDKVPVLGDLPLVGRLFQSKAENRIKSNVIIFVKAEIIDATGQPFRNSASSSEAGDNLLLPSI